MRCIMAWLRGPVGSVVDYWHSEGACCQSDNIRGVPNAHLMCKVDMDYTLRKALDIARDKTSDIEWNTEATPWCVVCLGVNAKCEYCHSTEELTENLSQRQKAANELLAVWKDAPLSR